jgi:benzoyl-CoA reductase/2-hydroxyglutaryl-CoA dehydratase subunit BcrC/BadD/HgdB
MIELLKLCGFTEDDINTELPRVERAFERLNITAADIENGKQRLTKYYDIKLEGVRKAFRLCMLELVNLMLAREEGKKKIIFGIMIPKLETIGYALMSKSSEVFTAHHCWAFMVIVGCVFDKLVPILEAAEKKWYKAGAVAHCANLKTLLGIIALDMIPKPDLLVTSGFLCETAPKNVELLHELYDIPMFCWDSCYDKGSTDYDDEKDRAIDFAANSLRRLVEKIENIVGFQITDGMLQDALESRSRFDRALGRVQSLIHNSDPLPLSPTHDNLWMCLSSLTFNNDTIEDAVDVANTIYKEVQERVSKGLGVMPKGSPRVLGEVFAHHADPSLEHLACEMGIALVVASGTPLARSENELKDPYKAMSLASESGLSDDLTMKIPMQIEICKRMNIDGVLNRYHVGCRTVAGDALVIQNAIEKELGIPALLLEWENFDPRVHNNEEYRRRLEVFKSMMTSRGG